MFIIWPNLKTFRLKNSLWFAALADILLVNNDHRKRHENRRWISSAGNATLLHNGLLGMPLAPALAGYPFAARPPVPSAYPAGLAGLEFAPYTTRPGAIFDYGLEPSIVGAVKPRRPIREHPYQR